VTARFVTREVHRLVSVELLGAGGELETLSGTPVHPVWSLDRGDWVPLAELTEGETLQGQTGPAIVLHLSLHQAAQPVYNLEIHGEHVYQVGELGVLVHNATSDDCLKLVAPGGPVSPRHFADSPNGIRLFEEAKAFRSQLPGSAASKQYRNIVVGDVIVDGQRRTARFANTPEIPGKQLGIHSEERLIEWYDILKNQQGRDVTVLSVFSDRIPCGTNRANCIGKLGDAFGLDLDVFFNILKGSIR
jgi:hypothetical protein